MIRSIYYRQDGELLRDLEVDEIKAIIQEEHGLLWLDLSEEATDTLRPILRETFGFHPLAVDDALEETHVPKVDDWQHYLYIVLHAIAFDQRDDEPVYTLELDVFLGRNFLVTYQSRPIAAIRRLWDTCQRDERQMQRGSARLLYTLADDLVAAYLPVIEEIDESIDEIEDQIFDNPGPSLLARIFSLKRALLHLRRILMPQREVFNKLARGDFAVLGVEERIFFRDVYDHVVRLHDITEGLRDLIGGALDTYLSVVSNRMNEVMKTLTIITTLFMPLAFLSGFFGMNFFQPVLALEAWTGKIAFSLMLLSVLIVPMGMFLWMRKRAWM
jgi:magnesium transporter